MDITKDLEGKAIFAIPTGNNARRSGELYMRIEEKVR